MAAIPKDPTVYDLTRDEIAQYLEGTPRYRVDQLWQGLYSDRVITNSNFVPWQLMDLVRLALDLVQTKVLHDAAAEAAARERLAAAARAHAAAPSRYRDGYQPY